MTRPSATSCRVQVYLSDPRVASALIEEAEAGGLPLSQAAGLAIMRGLRAECDRNDRLVRLETAVEELRACTGRDVQIVQELLIEIARAVFIRLPDTHLDRDPLVQSAVSLRIDRLLDSAAARIMARSARALAGQETVKGEVHPQDAQA